MSLRKILLWTGVAVLVCMAVTAQPTTQTIAAAHADSGARLQVPFAATQQALPADALRGGRGPEHCALSIGVFVGGALGFFANPFVGSAVMRLGFMAAALHCA